MDAQRKPDSTTVIVGQPPLSTLSALPAGTTLTGRRLLLARVGWFALVAYFLALFAFSIPPHYQELATVREDHDGTFYLLRPAEAEALASIGITPTGYAIVLDAAALLLLGSFIALGFVIFLRRSDNDLTLVFSLTVIGAGLLLNSSISSLASRDPDWYGAVQAVRTIATVLVTLAFCVLPDGQFIPRWSRYALLPWTVLAAYVMWAPNARGTFVIMAVFTLGMAAQWYRYRHRMTEPQRQSTRLLVLSMFILVTGSLFYFALPELFRSLQSGLPRALFNLLGAPILVILPGLTLPLALGLSISRYRLWNIDAIFNRALLFSAVTVVLAVLYVLFVLALQQLFQAFTGGSQSSVAVAVSTVALTLLFQPVFQRVRAFVSNRLWVRQISPRTTQTLQARTPHLNSAEGRLTGRRIGTYKVGPLLGQGGVAEVYRAQHSGLNREVALKVLSSGLQLDSTTERRFELEARTIAQLSHPNIIQVFDAGQMDGVYYIAMALIEGPTLTQFLRKQAGRMPLADALSILEDVAAALDFAHANGVIHRDVKPGNVMLMPAPGGQQRAILTDFGLARVLVGANANTHTGAMMGTLSYVAPDQIYDPRTVTHAADIYALGMIAYEMVTGEVAFSGESVGEVLMAHLQRPIPDPRLRVPDLPGHAAEALLQALHKQPAERFQSAGAFVAALAGGSNGQSNGHHGASQSTQQSSNHHGPQPIRS